MGLGAKYVMGARCGLGAECAIGGQMCDGLAQSSLKSSRMKKAVPHN